MADLDLELELNIKTNRPFDAPEEYAAIVPDLAILVRGSGDDEALLRAVEEEVDFLLADMNSKSTQNLLQFLISRGVAFRCELVPEAEAESIDTTPPVSHPISAWQRNDLAVSDLSSESQNVTKQRFRVPAIA